jgi:hypothetical protein
MEDVKTVVEDLFEGLFYQISDTSLIVNHTDFLDEKYPFSEELYENAKSLVPNILKSNVGLFSPQNMLCLTFNFQNNTVRLNIMGLRQISTVVLKDVSRTFPIFDLDI